MLADHEKFAEGFHAAVYPVGDKERLRGRAARADVVRKENHEKLFYFAELFVKHRLCYLLFPEHFINVVASSTMRSGLECISYFDWDTGLPMHNLYSVKANVPIAHAHYGTVLTGGIIGPKRQTCPCAECAEHKRVHVKHRSEVDELHRTLLDCGIEVPYNDGSDWCVTQEGNIVFFEIDVIDLSRLKQYIESQDIDAGTRKEIDRLIQAMEKIATKNI